MSMLFELSKGPTPAHIEKAQTDTWHCASVKGIGSFVHLYVPLPLSFFIGFSLHFNSLRLFDWFLISTPLQNHRTSSSRPLSHP